MVQSLIELIIPLRDADPLRLNLKEGDVFFILGANGVGKSSLLSFLCAKQPDRFRRISAHRQNWFSHHESDLTPTRRRDLEAQVRQRDSFAQNRYRLDFAGERPAMAIFDLMLSENKLNQEIVNYLRTYEASEAHRLVATVMSPIKIINEILKESNIFIEIIIDKDQVASARKNNGPLFPIAQLSDGERNALLIAAEILTAPAGSIFLIDEPERHLHRSIILPLLKTLFGKRSDCGFVISTHEALLPAENKNANTLLVRDCGYEGDVARSWVIDHLKPGDEVNDEIKLDILGARHRILFVEGKQHSLDAAFYSMLFPDRSIIAKSNCREVEQSVRALTSSPNLHWVEAIGIIDGDQRALDESKKLLGHKVHVLPYYSIEALYFREDILRRIAESQGRNFGNNLTDQIEDILSEAVSCIRENREQFLKKAIYRSVRRQFLSKIPPENSISELKDTYSFEIDVHELRSREEHLFDEIISENDWERILGRYPIRESKAPDRIARRLHFQNVSDYYARVRTLLREDETPLNDLRRTLQIPLT